MRNTGIGSLPGTDIREAIAIVIDGHPDFFYLPELPSRGPGSDLIGRTAALLARVASDLAVMTTPTGWRFTDAPGVAVRRADAYWREDLDTFEEMAHGVDGAVKVQLAGPVTLAATIELRRGERAIADRGALAEIFDAHREAAVRHIADLRHRLPGAQLVVQFDEPALTGALAGTIPTQSGWGRLAPLEEPVIREWHGMTAAAVVAAGARPWLHSCAPQWPIAFAHRAGYLGISGDVSLLRARDDEAIGEAVEAGLDLVTGLIPTAAALLAAAPRSELPTVQPVLDLFARTGLTKADLRRSVVVTPTCGLGGLSWPAAHVAMRRVVEAARVLADAAEGMSPHA